jgi:ribose transport system substrate-binding protein
MHAQKKNIATIAAALLSLGLTMSAVGCSRAASVQPTTGASGGDFAPSIYCNEKCKAQLTLKAAPDTVHCNVGVSWSSASFPYGAKSTTQIPEFAKKFLPHMSVTVADGQGDATTQSGQIDDMVAHGINVLIVSPQDASALAGAVSRAKAAGVKVIAADRNVDTEVDTYIGSDNVEAGKVAGAAVVAAHPHGARVVELAGSLGASPTIDRGNGFRSAIAGSPVEIIASQSADYDRAQGLKVTEDLLQRFGTGQIDVLYAHNDQMAFGAIQAITEAGRQGEITVYGVDGESGALDRIKQGTYAATVGYPLVVNESVIGAAKLCSGEPIDKRIVLDSTLIDSKNVDQYIAHPPQ